ncbi:type II toxin-antitoxin system VapC family toxin [Cyanobium gracile]|uniref:Type II toxin-antitoxin system VapC family toxin n=1 Tax=Cyanobium gracile UHCC 0281 TaxID=3110309 RepID=A0ABU5SWF5_9CYAN|nr:type II toxin-antitoxin system VapC family toxin [Cyanobium gracile]MEA5442377.1 type II toxin-antitoxin system VapC family toxin [Cyanobium gracile UHCC 0281]
MDLATVSPKRVHEQFGLSPGQQLQVMALRVCVGRIPSKGRLTACERFLDVLDAEASLVVPSISILEVVKWVLREHSESQAIQAAAVMQRGLVVDLDSRLAMASAQLSHTLRLPMADSIILARLHTMDTDFKGLNDVELMIRN